LFSINKSLCEAECPAPLLSQAYIQQNSLDKKLLGGNIWNGLCHRLNKKDRGAICAAISKNLPYSELSLFAGLLSVVLVSVDLVSFGVLSLLESAFFIPDVSPEGDLWSVA
jgi:hypothetical protein